MAQRAPRQIASEAGIEEHEDESEEANDETATIEVPERYAREIKERQRIIEACPIKVFTSSINPRWSWPWKLNPSNEARPSTSDSSEEVIIDPGLYNYCGPLEAAHAAHKTDADYLLARDLTPVQYPDVDFEERERYEVSAGRVANYFAEHHRLRERASVTLGKWELAHDAEPIAPIQPPYEKSLAALNQPIQREVSNGETVTLTVLEETDYIAIGGLLDFTDAATRVEKLHEVRDIVGEETKIHALAPGTDLKVIRTIRDNPDLMDSLDVSTPENAPANGKIPDKTWSQHNHSFPRGVDSTTVRGQFSGAIAMQLAYMLSPLCDDDVLEAEYEHTQQQTFDAIG